MVQKKPSKPADAATDEEVHERGCTCPDCRLDRKMQLMKARQPSKPADANADYDSLAKENRRLKELNADLNEQCRVLRESRPLSKEEEQQIAALRMDRDRLMAIENRLAMWLRDNKALEIKQGRHVGLSVAEICIMYMAKGLV